MHRRSFLLGTLSTAIGSTIILTGRRSPAAEIETWRSYNTGRFEEIRTQLATENSRWIDSHLSNHRISPVRRMYSPQLPGCPDLIPSPPSQPF